MSFDVDVAIFIGFLTVTFVLGLYSSRGITTIKEYAVGDRNFSTPTIVATLVATWISGEFFYSNIYETYNLGLNAIWIASGDFLCLLIIGMVFAPRMGEFLGNLSIAEAMGDLYGKRIRVITAISGALGAAGIIAIQLRMAGSIFEYALELPSSYGIISAAIIVIIYSSLGGIKSVTFTDVIQFFTFGIVIPLIAYVLFTSIDNLDIVADTLINNPLYDYNKVFDFSEPLPFRQLFLFLLFALPGLNPANFQRVAMSRNTIQVGRSFIIAAFTCLLLLVIVNWIAVLTFTINPSLNANEIIQYIAVTSPYPGLKGVMLVGVIAMIMSTVDSYINSTSILIVHDFCKPLKIKFIKNELFSARIVSILIGIFSLALSLREGDSLQALLVVSLSFYFPIVIVPFSMAVLGFRTSEKSVLLGMAAGLTTVVVWDYVLGIEAANSAFFGMVANLAVLLGSHYLLKQPGGWVGIKDTAPLIQLRNERKLKISKFMHELKTFNIFNTCRSNCPKGEGLISMLGIFCMISAFASIHTLAPEYQNQYKYLIDTLYPITLFLSSALIAYPLWLESWKGGKLIGVVYNISTFSVLICFSFLMVLISQFSEIQLMVFMINFIIASLLVSWRWALLTIIFGAVITSFFYYQYLPENLQEELGSLQFKIVYLLLLISSTLIIFLKPKQDQQELTEQKVDYQSNQLADQKMELSEALELKTQFLRNLPHETRTPITGITSLGEALYESYDKLAKSEVKGYLKTIAESSTRLSSYVNNLIDLSKLSGMTYEFDKEAVNLTELIYTRVAICRKLYSDEANKDKQEFIFALEDNIVSFCDKYYISRVIDNIIINAIQYCKDGKITIKLGKNETGDVECSVHDEGIGIPSSELISVFGAFIVSSKTKTASGGRGVGLALAYKIISSHNGSIYAETNPDKGVTFTFTLPKK